MPAIFINPNTEEHINLLAQLKQQNQDLRVFVSDKKEKDYIEKLPGKKAIGDIYDDSHIYTASEGAFCGIFYEGSDKSLRDVFIKSIKQSSLKRILWISFINETNEITNIENLIYILCKSDTNYEDTILRLEEINDTEEKFIDLS